MMGLAARGATYLFRRCRVPPGYPLMGGALSALVGARIVSDVMDSQLVAWTLSEGLSTINRSRGG